MSKRQNRIIIPSAILAIALVLAWASFHQREEPIYDGRTSSEWLARIREGQWGTSDEPPIRAIGTNGIPIYLKWISFEESPLRHRIAMLVEHVFPRLRDRLVSPGRLANRVVCVFQILGPQAQAAIRELTRLAQTARDPARATRCLNSLGFIGPAAIPGILTLATNSPPPTRALALWKLADLGTNAVPVVPALRLALTDPDAYVTNTASRLLLKIAPDLHSNTPAQ